MRKSVLIGMMLLIFAGLLTSALSPPSGAEEIPCEPVHETPRGAGCEIAGVREGDSIELASEAERLVILVRSKSGIGGATVRLLEGVWPDVVVIRFRYVSGSRFKGLEGFSAMTGKLGVSSFLNNPTKPALCRLDKNGRIDEKSKVEAVELEIADKEDCVEVTLPMSSLGKDARSLKFSWVDQYR